MRRYLVGMTAFIISIPFCSAQLLPDNASFIQNNTNIYSIVVSRNDSVIYKKYYNQKKESTVFNDQSITKSIISLLIGIAIDKEYIISVDEEIWHYFPELKNDSDVSKQRITIRELMNQTSGFWHENLSDLQFFLSLKKPSTYVLKQPLVTEPGIFFHYNNAASHLLSLILTRSTSYSTFKFAKKFLFRPLGIKHITWKKMHDGYFDGSGLLSVYMNTADMNKIGRLILNHGNYNKKQIISKKWIDAILNPTISYHTSWGFENSIYSLCWYHVNYNGSDLTYALGWGGQFLLLIPDLHAVVCVNQNSQSASASKQSEMFLSEIFPVLFENLK